MIVKLNDLDFNVGNRTDRERLQSLCRAYGVAYWPVGNHWHASPPSDRPLDDPTAWPDFEGAIIEQLPPDWESLRNRAIVCLGHDSKSVIETHYPDRPPYIVGMKDDEHWFAKWNYTASKTARYDVGYLVRFISREDLMELAARDYQVRNGEAVQ